MQWRALRRCSRPPLIIWTAAVAARQLEEAGFTIVNSQEHGSFTVRGQRFLVEAVMSKDGEGEHNNRVEATR